MLFRYTDELFKKLNQALCESASDSKVHDAFKSVVIACGFENVPLTELPSHIQARQACATDCGISMGEYQKILIAARSEAPAERVFNRTINEIGERRGINPDHLLTQLLGDREMALAFVKKGVSIYKQLSPEFKADKEIALAAVTRHTDNIEPAIYDSALQFASPELQADREVVMAAVKENGFALRYASHELKADKEVVMAATKEVPFALLYAWAHLKADIEVVLPAVTQEGCALQYADQKFKADRSIVLTAVTQDGIALKYASSELKADKEVVLAAVKQNSSALRYASPQLQQDPEILAAC